MIERQILALHYYYPLCPTGCLSRIGSYIFWIHPFYIFVQSLECGVGNIFPHQRGFLIDCPNRLRTIRNTLLAINNHQEQTPRALDKHTDPFLGQRVIIWWLNNKSSVKRSGLGGQRVNLIILTSVFLKCCGHPLSAAGLRRIVQLE